MINILFFIVAWLITASNTYLSRELITDGNAELRMVPKLQWLGREARDGMVNLELPSTRVIITHTATEECLTIVKITITMMQMFGISINHNLSFYRTIAVLF